MTKPIPGAKRGRKPRPTPKAKPVWIGQISQDERDLVLNHTTARERRSLLIIAAMKNANKENSPDDNPSRFYKPNVV